VREHEAFEASGVLPAWEEKRAALDAQRLALHGQALTLEGRLRGGLANAVIIVRRLLRNAWTTHRWDTRPARCP
jgi:hypothetical protein